MPNVNDLGESKYLKKEDVDPAVVVEIIGYDRVNMAKDDKPPEWKYILKLRGISKQLPLNKDGYEKGVALNKTNGNRIAYITKENDFDRWTGKQIELYHDPMVEFGGNLVGGIRVRPVSTQGGLTQPQQQQHNQASDGPPPVDTTDYSQVDNTTHDDMPPGTVDGDKQTGGPADQKMPWEENNG